MPPDRCSIASAKALRSSTGRGYRGPARRSLLLGAAVLALLLAGLGCRGGPQRAAVPSPTPDPRLSLSQPTATARAGAAGAPVDCTLSVANRSGQTLSNLVFACELLDADGLPLGTGLGSLQNLADGQSRSVRTVVYGVRGFASARALVNSATFQ